MFNVHAWPHVPDTAQLNAVRIADHKSAFHSPEHELAIDEHLTVRVLEGGGARRLSGRITELSGPRLVAQVPEYVKPETCVRIDSDDGFILGVAVGCWREGQATLVALELQQVLHGVKRRESLQPSDNGNGFWREACCRIAVLTTNMFDFFFQSHLPERALVEYRAGLLDKKRLEMLEGHLLLCPTCQLQLEELLPPAAAAPALHLCVGG